MSSKVRGAFALKRLPPGPFTPFHVAVGDVTLFGLS